MVFGKLIERFRRRFVFAPVEEPVASRELPPAPGPVQKFDVTVISGQDRSSVTIEPKDDEVQPVAVAKTPTPSPSPRMGRGSAALERSDPEEAAAAAPESTEASSLDPSPSLPAVSRRGKPAAEAVRAK